MLAHVDAHRREAGAQRRSDRRHGNDRARRSRAGASITSSRCHAQETHCRASSVLAALARTLRQVLQVAMLGLGAWLVIDMQASSGIMIAATILLSRALQPVEHLISGWRALIEARGAWQRLGERTADVPADSQSRCPRRADASRSSGFSYAFAPSRPALHPEREFRARAR